MNDNVWLFYVLKIRELDYLYPQSMLSFLNPLKAVSKTNEKSYKR